MSDGLGLFSCKVCKLENRMEQDWVLHVTSQGHQRILSRRPGGGHGTWGDDPLEGTRAVAVEGCRTLKASALQIAQYLSQWGRLEEFICPTSLSGTKPETVYALYQEENSVVELLGVKAHWINEEPCLITRKYPGEEEANGNGNSFDFLEEKSRSSPQGDEETVTDSGAADEEIGPSDWEDPLPQPSEKWKWSPENVDTFMSLPLQEQLPKLFSLIELTSSEKAKRSRAAKDVQDILRKTFSSAYVFPYGHDLFGCAIKGDALRLCVDPYAFLGNKTSGVLPASKMSAIDISLIHQICCTYGGHDNPTFAFSSLYSLHSSLSQELSFKYKGLDVFCRFENFTSVQKSRLVRFIVRHDLRIWPLLMLLRYWRATFDLLPHKNPLRQGEIFEDYTLLLLLVFFLTRIKVIPSVLHLQSLSTAPLVIEDSDIAFACDHKIVPPAKISMLTEDKFIRTFSTLGLLKDFLEFFGGPGFEYKDNVLCVATGEFIPRRSFKPHLEKELPESIAKKYRFTTSGDLRVKKLDVSSSLVLQDPIVLAENVAEGMSEDEVTEFILRCQESVGRIGDFMDLTKPNVLTMFDEKPPVEISVPVPVPEPERPEPVVSTSSILRRSSPSMKRGGSTPSISSPKGFTSPKNPQIIKTENTFTPRSILKRRLSSSSPFVARKESDDTQQSTADSTIERNGNTDNDEEDHLHPSERKIVRIARISIKQEQTP